MTSAWDSAPTVDIEVTTPRAGDGQWHSLGTAALPAVSCRRGRQRAYADIEAGTCTFVASNDGGDLSTGNPLGIESGSGVRVVVTHDSTEYPLFTGFAGSARSRWEGVGITQRVVVSAKDALAVSGESDSFGAPLADRAVYWADGRLPSASGRSLMRYYPLTGGSRGALSARSAGRSTLGGEVEVAYIGTEGLIGYGTGMPPGGGNAQGVVELDPTLNASQEREGYYLTLSVNGAETYTHLSLCFSVNDVDGTLFTSNHGAPIRVYVDGDALTLDDTGGAGTITSDVPVTDGQPHNVIVGYFDDSGTEKIGMWVDGLLAGSLTTGSLSGSHLLGAITLGAYSDGGDVTDLMSGSIGPLGLFSTATGVGSGPSASDMSDFAEMLNAAANPAYCERTGDTVARLAQLGGFTAVDIDPGEVSCRPSSLANQSILQALTRVGIHTEGGIVYIDGSGTLVFRDRQSRRYSGSPAASISMAELARPPEVVHDEQRLISSGTIVDVAWAGSQSTVRVAPLSDPTAPKYLSALQTIAVDAVAAAEAAAIRVAEVWPNQPTFDSVTIDLLQTGRWDLLGIDVADVILLTGLPSQFVDIETGSHLSQVAFIVEGVSHDISVSAWELTFDVSRVEPYSPVVVGGAGATPSLTL